jgi:PLP dependent protein
VASRVNNDSRRSQLAENLAAARDQVSACARAGVGQQVTIVAVTKRFPVSDVLILQELGVTDVAENRQQEAAAKHADFLARGGDPSLRWHFIGQLQSNKAKSIAAFAHSVDTVDRPSVIAPLARGARASGRQLECLIQVSLAQGAAGQHHRGGCQPQEVLELAEMVTAEPELELSGAMGMAPLGGDPVSAYQLLADVAHTLQSRYPHASVISAGMSGDVQEAITAGATQVRLGTAILGERPPLG